MDVSWAWPYFRHLTKNPFKNVITHLTGFWVLLLIFAALYYYSFHLNDSECSQVQNPNFPFSVKIQNRIPT